MTLNKGRADNIGSIICMAKWLNSTHLLRETKLYKELQDEWNYFLLCNILDPDRKGQKATIEEQLIAWQVIADRNAWKLLPKWYGRRVRAMLKVGLLAPPKK